MNQIPEDQIRAIEEQLNRGELLPEIVRRRQEEMMLAYRVNLFQKLSTMSVSNPKGVLNELAKLFRIEALCVSLQLLPFHAALRFIAGEGMVNIGLNAVTCVTVVAYAVTHW